MICQRCRGWDCDADARFCSNCGSVVLPIDVKFNPTVIVLGGRGKADCRLNIEWRGTSEGPPDDLAIRLRHAHTGAALQTIALDSVAYSTEPMRASVKLDVAKWIDLRELGLLVAAFIEDRNQPLDAPVSPPLEHYLAINPQAGGVKVVDDTAMWRPEASYLEVPLQLASGRFAVIESASVKISLPHDNERSWSGRQRALPLESFRANEPNNPHVLLKGIFERPKFSIPMTISQEITRIAGTFDAQLEVRFVSGNAGENIVTIPFELRRAGPADPRIAMPSKRINALAGRKGRVGVELRNDGGEAFLVTGCSWELKNLAGATVLRGTTTELALLPACPFIGEPGARIRGELRPLFRDSGGRPLPAADYELAVAFTTDIGVELRRTVQISLHPSDRPAEGVISIDFGTTETAVAVHLADRGIQKRLIKLARVEFECDGVTVPGEPFEPTVAIAVCDPAQQQQLVWRYGREAELFAAGLKTGSGLGVRFFENLKWGLADGETEQLADGTRTTWAHIVEDYLRHVVELMETHPDCSGCVAQAFITKPALFGAERTRGLEQTFERIREGFVRKIRSISGETPMISESWTPAYALFPTGDMIRELFESKGNPPLVPLSEKDIANTLVVTCDVGGGSTDMSLFHISFSPQTRRVRVDELWSDTIDDVCGRDFGNLIERHLEAVVVAKIGGAPDIDLFDDVNPPRLDSLNFPIKRGSAADSSPEGIANARELKNLRMYFQSGEGAFRTIERENALGQILFDEAGRLRPSPLEKSEIERRFAPAIAAAGKIEDDGSGSLLTDQRLELVSADKRVRPIVFEVTDVKAAMIAITKKAHDRYFKKLKQKFVDAHHAIPEAFRNGSGERTRFLLTGRGGQFVVVKAFLNALAIVYFGEKCRQNFSQGEQAKWITSLGGALIGYSNSRNTAIDFEACIEKRLAMETGLDWTGTTPTFSHFAPKQIHAPGDIVVLSVDLPVLHRLSNQDTATHLVYVYTDGREPDRCCAITMQQFGPDFRVGMWIGVKLGTDGQFHVTAVDAASDQEAIIAVREKLAAS
jgi:hypothetical protein